MAGGKRTKHVPTVQTRQVVKNMTNNDAAILDISAMLGVNRRTLEKYYSDILKKRGGGRPAHKPTEHIRRQVEALAGFGITQEQISKVVKIGIKVLERDYREELDTGGTKATAKVAESLYKQATSGNVAAAIFWMKARAGWTEKYTVQNTGKDEGPIEIADAREKLKKLIDQKVKSRVTELKNAEDQD